MYKSTTLLAAIVIAITLLSTIFSGGSLSDLIGNNPRLAEIGLEYESVSEGMNTILFNDDGTINYTLRAETQIQFADNHLEVEKPFIKLFQTENHAGILLLIKARFRTMTKPNKRS